MHTQPTDGMVLYWLARYSHAVLLCTCAGAPGTSGTASTSAAASSSEASCHGAQAGLSAVDMVRASLYYATVQVKVDQTDRQVKWAGASLCSVHSDMVVQGCAGLRCSALQLPQRAQSSIETGWPRHPSA